MSSDYYIGLMSGTSMDAIDAVLVDFGSNKTTIVESLYHPIPNSLRDELQALCQVGENEIDRMGQADRELGTLFAEAVNQLLKNTSISKQEISAVGSHGQTIRHMPSGNYPFTCQIGDANQIAEHTGITTVADFRRRDMAAGGQGAPLVCAFHAASFHSPEHTRVILNIGGISNITILPADKNTDVSGFDTGPGNGLMDAWINKHKQKTFDQDGRWAASGQVNEKLLSQLLTNDYFDKTPPKSTGRELYNLNWLEQQLSFVNENIADADVQATLCELTVISIANAIDQYCNSAKEIFVCGGGSYNTNLMTSLIAKLKPMKVKTTNELGIPAEWVEATAFAWLAKETLNNRPGNVPSVTGAEHSVVLGGIYPAR